MLLWRYNITMDIGNKLKNKSGKQAKILISEMLYDLINDLDINVKLRMGILLVIQIKKNSLKWTF